jgi:hypothetical protein
VECPCNSAYGGDPIIYPNTKTKKTEHNFHEVGLAACPSLEIIEIANDCFLGAKSIGINASSMVTKTVIDPTLPSGCSVTIADDVAIVYFNTVPNSSVSCSSGPVRTGRTTTSIGTTLSLKLETGSGTAGFTRSAPGVYCGANHNNVLASFTMPDKDSAPATLAKCEAFCAETDACWGCSVVCSNNSTVLCNWVAISLCGDVLTWQGLINGDISEKVRNGTVTITISGPADGWFGVGFNALHMSDQPWAIIMNDTAVIEQKLGTCGDEGHHCPGTSLPVSVTVLSSTLEKGVRTYVLSRPFLGASDLHYTFDPTVGTINFISAIGFNQNFAYHKDHTQAVISLTSTDGLPNCICDAGAVGAICTADGQTCDRFVKDCVPPPDADLLLQDNPTCNSQQYGGGLRCCVDNRTLLDTDQIVVPTLLRYHMKIRFWFQEYRPATPPQLPSHYNLDRYYIETEANAGEYDVPPAFALPNLPIVGYPDWPLNTPTPGTTCTGSCPNGPDCECIHTITYHFTMSDARLIYAGGHCHVPSCLSMELYRNDTGTPELLCRQIPQFGQGSDAKFDEAGYEMIPPCLWGDEEGLAPSFFMPAGTPLISIKRNRNTENGHYGEMASWQMRGTAF